MRRALLLAFSVLLAAGHARAAAPPPASDWAAGLEPALDDSAAQYDRTGVVWEFYSATDAIPRT